MTVSETIRVAGSAIFSITASGSSGANRYCDDRADDPRLPAAVRGLQHQRVEAVLGLHRLLHLSVERHHADAADPPVQRLALVHQLVEVHRLVGAVEAADTEVHDARP